MKKKIKIGLLVLVVGVVAYFLIQSVMSNVPQGATKEEMNELFGENGDEEFLETATGISYNGKVIPAQTYYYNRSGVKTFNKVYVQEGDQVLKGDLLFDYEGNSQTSLKAQILQRDFLNYQQQLDDYYTRLAELEENLKGADVENTVYINYLNVEINNTKQTIEQIKLKWLETEEQIQTLKDANQESLVVSDIDGLIYKVNDPKQTSVMSAESYIILYSNEKKVRINVSEYEYKYFSEGQEVTVYVEALNKEYTSVITKVDDIPNNLEVTSMNAYSDTSYYYVEVSVPTEIPYGYSVIVTVPRDE